MSCCQELSDGIARLPNVPRRISAASRFGRYGRSSASYVRGKLTKARSASARPSSVVLAHRGAGFPVHDAPRIAGSTEIKKRTLHGERFIITKAEQNSSAFSTVRRTQQRHTSSEVCLRKCVSAYYKMMQISPPLPSLIIRDSVSPNFSRASSGICSSFA